jgi:hypothetical protein
MTVAFHTKTLFFRGSENALWDYAVLNETVLGNRSVICFRESPELATSPVAARWRSRFPVLTYRSRRDLSHQLRQQGVETLYMIKPGLYDGMVVEGVRNCIHAMYLTEEFHGDSFAFVSRWMSRAATGRKESYVPHFVTRFASRENLRTRLGIPAGAKVFGRHGAADTFNIPFARKAVLAHARRHPEDHFVFLNTNPMNPRRDTLPNIHHLPATIDPGEKGRFLATCDAMVHAQESGETFGLAIAEFAVLGKPVITLARPRTGSHAHLEMLRGRGLLYANQAELETIFREFTPREVRGTEYEEYGDPGRVMDFFRRRFLE